jgi:hypothetical protein
MFFLFVGGKGLNVKDNNKAIFPVYDGKCLSRLFGPPKKPPWWQIFR